MFNSIIISIRNKSSLFSLYSPFHVKLLLWYAWAKERRCWLLKEAKLSSTNSRPNEPTCTHLSWRQSWRQQELNETSSTSNGTRFTATCEHRMYLLLLLLQVSSGIRMKRGAVIRLEDATHSPTMNFRAILIPGAYHPLAWACIIINTLQAWLDGVVDELTKGKGLLALNHSAASISNDAVPFEQCCWIQETWFHQNTWLSLIYCKNESILGPSSTTNME